MFVALARLLFFSLKSTINGQMFCEFRGRFHCWQVIGVLGILFSQPIGSMYGIFTYIWLIFMVNVGEYTIHGSYGQGTRGLQYLVFEERQTQRKVFANATGTAARTEKGEFTGV